MSYQETIRASYAHVETEADVPNPGEHSESASVDRERVRSPDPRPRTPDPRPRTPAPTAVPSLQPPPPIIPTIADTVQIRSLHCPWTPSLKLSDACWGYSIDGKLAMGAAAKFDSLSTIEEPA